MLTVLRTVVDVQKVFSFTSQNALIVRAEADTMALVEKLIADLDKARPEVIIDVMVMEVNSTHMRNITAAFASTGITTSAIFAPRPGITTPGHPERDATATAGTTPRRRAQPRPPRRRRPLRELRLPRARPATSDSAERAGPHLQRGLLADQPAGSRARSRAERCQTNGAASRRRFARSDNQKAHPEDRREGSHGERAAFSRAWRRRCQSAGQYAVHLSGCRA